MTVRAILGRSCQEWGLEGLSQRCIGVSISSKRRLNVCPQEGGKMEQCANDSNQIKRERFSPALVIVENVFHILLGREIEKCTYQQRWIHLQNAE